MTEPHYTLLSMYQKYPTEKISIQDLVSYANDRLNLYKVLKTINPNESFASIKVKLQQALNDTTFLDIFDDLRPLRRKRALRIDLISHFILRLVYGQKSFSFFFVDTEVKWFKIRFKNAPEEEKRAFVRSHFKQDPINDEIRVELDLSPEQTWYSIDFRRVLFLVGNCLCFLHLGLAYIQHDQLEYVFYQEFEEKLEIIMNHVRRTLPNNSSDQLKTVLNSIILVEPYNYSGIYSTKPVSLKELENAIDKFPLCMRHRFEHLRETHHLRYFSRMELGLFLKGSGLSLEDSLKFWIDELKQSTERKHTINKYEYGLRHIYGTVGHRVDLQPYSCKTIIEQSIGLGQVNGCPFAHWDRKVLKEKLQEEKVEMDLICDIVKLADEERYGEACARYSKCIKGVVTHPNDYFVACSEVPDIEDIFLPDDNH